MDNLNEIFEDFENSQGMNDIMWRNRPYDEIKKEK